MIAIESMFSNLGAHAPMLGRIFAMEPALNNGFGRIEMVAKCRNPRTASLFIQSPLMDINHFASLQRPADAFAEMYRSLKHGIEKAVLKEVGFGGEVVAENKEELYGITSLVRNGNSFRFETIVTLIINEPLQTNSSCLQ